METTHIKKQLNKIDFMLTGHSKLRDKYLKLSLLIDLLTLILSVILNTVVFLDPQIVHSIHFDESNVRFIIGAISVFLFLLSLVSLRVDWKKRAEQHIQTTETLTQLKSSCKLIKNSESFSEEDIISEINKMSLLIDKLPAKIPEKDFIKIKGAHKRKIELSKLIDEYPGSSVLLLKIRLWVNSNFLVIINKRKVDDNNGL